MKQTINIISFMKNKIIPKRTSVFLFLSFASFLIVIIFLRNNNLANSFFNLLALVPYYDKIAHFFLMGILAFLAVTSLIPILPYPKSKSTTIVLGTLITIIALEECSQIFIATRSFSLADFACDCLGVASFGFYGHCVASKQAQSK